jgi:hypothetical protein
MKIPEREDISRFVVHLTRDHQDSSAEENLLSIIRSQKIEARNAHCLFQHKFGAFQFSKTLRSKFNSVCLTEVPFAQLQHLAAPIVGRKIKLQPYGAVFRKADMLLKGASPAIYINAKGTSVRDYLLGQFEAHFQTRSQYRKFKADFAKDADAIINYYSLINVISDGHDFSWEREWRVMDDLRFDLMELYAIIVPDPDAFMKRCEKEFPSKSGDLALIPMVSPAWNVERIIEELSIKLWRTQID